jgi:UDP-glucose 4-epimerase
MSVLITGGAGFIGSHLVDYLMEKEIPVRIFDNLSTGSKANVDKWMGHDNFDFVKGNLLEPSELRTALQGCNEVYHFAANPEVRSWLASSEEHFRHNIEGTFNLLNAIRDYGCVDLLVFSSTSTVYGEAELVPIPEIYAPLKPISNYGASKLAAEALICSNASMYGFRSVIFRLANIVGPRSNHGVIYDFVQKLRNDRSKLEVLGDGTQSKSYLYVDDCIDGMIYGAKASDEKVEILNIGSEDRVSVLEIAEIVIEETDSEGAEVVLTGGVNGGRGWKGDVKLMQLDISRLKGLGWYPNIGSAEAVRRTASHLSKRL